MVFTRQQCSGGTSSASTSSWNALFSNDLEYSGSSGVMDRIRRNKSTNQMVLRKNEINLMDLPTEIIEHILSFLPYKNISSLRMVCRRMDGICGTRLNVTFYKLQHKMMMKFQEIKSKMPRRESARRQHPLACESDIIETLHMRLTLLQMSFGKHIEKKHCCFFPGEILDEVFRVLHYVRVTPNLTLPYKATDELFDLTSMAMEYFKEKIEPRLPEIYMKNDTIIEDKFSMVECVTYETFTPQISSHLDTVSVETDESIGTTKSTMILRKRINRFRQTLRRYNTNLAFLRREMNNYKLKFNNQQKLIMEFIKRTDAYEKKNEEWSRKYSTLLQELNKCVSELQYWRSNAGNVSPVRNIEEQLLGELRPSDDALIDEKQSDKEDVKDADKASTSSEELKSADNTKQQKTEDRKYVEQLGTDTLNNPDGLDDKVIVAHEYINSDIPSTSTMNSDRPVSYKRKFSSNLRSENKKFKRCINLRSKSRQSSRK